MSDSPGKKTRPAEGEARLISRPPIVAVMGHVDHGKTTLLDYIRKASVAAREAGGITQSIGAYEIVHPSTSSGQVGATGKKITFIDTPGHEAFIQMRTRGATAADLAILVVAADEGVKPQTEESVRILNETKTPFVVAITKADKPNADLDKVKNELAAAGVLLEGFGGSVSYQPVSAKTGEHVPELLDLLLLTAELENLSYDPAVPAEGYILEATLDRRRGMEASVIVTNGTLRQGEPIATANGKGKIKILEDFTGKAIKALEPSAPALILGWEELPRVGDTFKTGPQGVVDLAQRPTAALTNSETAQPASAPNPGAPVKTLNIILKAADSGSLEALSQIVQAIADPSTGSGQAKPLKLVASAVGDVGDNDIKLAISTGSIVFAFKSKVDKGAKTIAESNRIKVITSEIIYELVQNIEEFLKQKEAGSSVAELEVLAVFNQQKLDKQVVGGKVTKGAFRNKAVFEIERPSTDSTGSPQASSRQGPIIVGTGRVTNLQQNKQDAREVEEGKECGLLVGSAIAIAAGDKLIVRE